MISYAKVSACFSNGIQDLKGRHTVLPVNKQEAYLGNKITSRQEETYQNDEILESN